MEIFFRNGISIYLNFPEGELDSIIQKLVILKKKKNNNFLFNDIADPKKILEKSNKTKKWLAGQISNFEYLMFINNLANRSYNDITQYIVFPWVFKEYSKNKLYIDYLESYRDMSKTMGAMGNKERIELFQERYFN